jgi:hypothetical protein
MIWISPVPDARLSPKTYSAMTAICAISEVWSRISSGGAAN